ncbi:hypothetical protein V2J09_012589 [Rumex salicifolius]
MHGAEQFIHAKIEGTGGSIVHLFVVYAAPTIARRRNLWGDLKGRIQSLAEPVFIGGDFNTILRLDERTGGNGRLSPESVEFGRWVNEVSLVDMGFHGGRYTWRRGASSDTYIAKRLDRVFCCPRARILWPEAVIKHLPFLSLDHSPVYLSLTPRSRGYPERRPFRFEVTWLSHPSFKELLKASWDPSIDTPTALSKPRGGNDVASEIKGEVDL